jgi:cation transport regulator ChaC
MIGWVFGYGSLVDPNETNENGLGVEPFMGSLIGYRRAWNVAMHNTSDVNDHKYYRDSLTGERTDIYVVFLNVYPSPGDEVNGVLIPVDESLLDEFDRREVNYARLDVTTSIRPASAEPVWTYTATEAGVERYRRGQRESRAFVSAQYYTLCEVAFENRGPDAVTQYRKSTDACEVPLKKLDLIRRPGATGN